MIPKIKIVKKWKKYLGDIILLHMGTINEDHMIWFLKYKAQQTYFLSIQAIFCPFTPLTTQEIKNQNFDKMKKYLEILSFNKCVPWMKIIWRMVPEIWSTMDRIFVTWAIFYPFCFQLFHVKAYLELIHTSKMDFFYENSSQPLTLKYFHKSLSYTPLTIRKIKILKKWKKHLEIL